MRTGPQIGKARNGDERTFEQKAGDAWVLPPDWIIELARKADATKLKGAAEAIGYTVGLVSAVIGNKYKGDLRRVEQMVRGALMAETLDCPILGDIGRDRCLIEQKEPFSARSSMRAQLYFACRNGCPHFREAARNDQPEGGSVED